MEFEFEDEYEGLGEIGSPSGGFVFEDERPGLYEQFKRGASEARVGTLGMVGRGLQGMAAAGDRPVLTAEEWSYFPRSRSPEMTAEMDAAVEAQGPKPRIDLSDAALARLAHPEGRIEPEGVSENVAYGVGQAFGLPEGYAAGFLAPGGRALAAKASTEIASGALSGGLYGYGESQDWPEAGKFAASMVGGLTPAGVRSGVHTATGAMTRRPVEAAAARSSGLRGRNVNPATAARVSGRLKSMVPQVPDEATRTRVRDVPAAVSKLDEATAAAPWAERPVTTQVLGEGGGEAFESMTAAMSRGDSDFATQLAGQRFAATEALKRHAQALRPGVYASTDEAFDAAILAYGERAQSIADEATAAWSKVSLEDMPKVRMTRIKDRILELQAQAGKAQQGRLPKQFQNVLETFEDVESMAELQSLRSDLLATSRAGYDRFAQGSSQKVLEGQYARALLPEVEKVIDDFSKAPGAIKKTAAYRKALAATRTSHDLLGEDPMYRFMLDPGERRGLLAALRKGKTKTASRLIRMFQDEPDSLQAFRRVVVDEIISDELTMGEAKKGLRAIGRDRRLLNQFFPKEHVQNMETLLRRAETIRSGRAGTRAAAMGTGTGTMDPVAALLDLSVQNAPGMQGSYGMMAAVKDRAVDWIKRHANAEYTVLLKQAMLEPDLAADLLRLPGPAEMPAWEQRMRHHLLRAGLLRPGLIEAGEISNVTP